MTPASETAPPPSPERERALEIMRALRRYHRRLERKVEALGGDLAEAERAPLLRRSGEALLAYLRQVPARARSVALPDPHEPARTLEIALDPALSPQANAARYFKRAAKAERALGEIPPRIAAAEAEAHALGVLLKRLAPAEEQDLTPALLRALDDAAAKLPPGVRPGVRRGGAARAPSLARVAAGEARAPSARLQPRRLKSREGWEVLIGRSNEGNDYVTHRLARPEDYWFHVHGAAGSHVVLRRGKGKNEPSRQTLEEVAAWAAYYSQARTAGKVPVIVTRKKYVRKPRKAPAGQAVCEREKTLMVRPQEPERRSAATEEAHDG
jgi:predicted ribosome quality control (RQC) complex YloA/Tae2 family protein